MSFSSTLGGGVDQLQEMNLSLKINKDISGLQILNYNDINSSDFCIGKFLKISDYNISGVIAHNTSEFKDAIQPTKVDNLKITVQSTIGRRIGKLRLYTKRNSP